MKNSFIIIGFTLILLFSNCKSQDMNILNPRSLHPYRNIPALNSMAELSYPFEVKKLKLSDEIEIAYVDEGKGAETILFIHGLGSYLPAWKKNIEHLSNHFRCIAIDLPGYGKSSKLPHSGSMRFYAETVDQFADKLGLGKIWVAGHSMGGQIAMVMALYHPERVEGLILAAPAGFEKFTEGQKQWFRNVMTLESVKNTSVSDIQNNLAHNFYRLPKDAEFMITDRIAMRSASDFEAYCHAVVQSVNGMVNEPVYPFLNKIKHPTPVLFGENDNLIPNRFLNPGPTRQIAENGVAQMQNASLVMMPKTGHFLQFENAESFNNEMKSFILEASSN